MLGKTFTVRGLASVSGTDEEDADAAPRRSRSQGDPGRPDRPFSPERGQYEFLHALVQRVAYDTLSRKERKARHIAVAAYLEADAGPDDPEIVEVVAAHYLEAYRAAPDDDDAGSIQAMARDRLTRAAERAASLAANEEAERYFADAAGLTSEPHVRAELLERAGEAARAGARFDKAEATFRGGDRAARSRRNDAPGCTRLRPARGRPLQPGPARRCRNAPGRGVRGALG